VLRLELARRARRDLQRLEKGELRRVRRGLEQLAEESKNLDIKALAGHAPWKRLRVGDSRIIFRELSSEEEKSYTSGQKTLLVERIVDRADLDRVTRTL
jgi:mRNA-degrading endonuclease RelE of RelBE toxin-antitoxin system